MEHYRRGLSELGHTVYMENRSSFIKQAIKAGLTAGAAIVLYKWFRRSIDRARKEERTKIKEEYKSKLDRKCKEYEEIKERIRAKISSEKKKKK